MLAHEAYLVYFCSMEKRVQVIYDDGCPTCTLGVHFAEGIDLRKELEFVGMNTTEGQRVISEHGLDMKKSAYVIENGAVSERAHMMRDVLARGGFIGLLLGLPFRVPYLGNALYDLLALHRRHVTRTKR